MHGRLCHLRQPLYRLCRPGWSATSTTWEWRGGELACRADVGAGIGQCRRTSGAVGGGGCGAATEECDDVLRCDPTTRTCGKGRFGSVRGVGGAALGGNPHKGATGAGSPRRWSRGWATAQARRAADRPSTKPPVGARRRPTSHYPRPQPVVRGHPPDIATDHVRRHGRVQDGDQRDNGAPPPSPRVATQTPPKPPTERLRVEHMGDGAPTVPPGGCPARAAGPRRP